MARAAFGGIAEFRKWAASHCDVARLLGTRMGLSAQVQQALRHLYERWDGDGMPGDLRGTQIPLAVRLMQVAQDADVAWRGRLFGWRFEDNPIPAGNSSAAYALLRLAALTGEHDYEKRAVGVFRLLHKVAFEHALPWFDMVASVFSG